MSENPYASSGDDNDASRQKKGPRIWAAVLTVFGIGALLIALLLPATRSSRPAARRNACMNELKHIGLALHNYEAAFHALPPAYTVDADGKPLHSWRTLILPFLEEQRLYQTIDLAKPWDDPANSEAFNTGISVYHCPDAVCPANHTTYLAVVAANGCFRPIEPRHFSEITDGLSQTLMVIEAPSEQSVHWMSPQDAGEQLVMGFGPDSKLAHWGGTHALFVDGSVRFLDAELPAAQRRAMISIAGHDVIAEENK